MHTCQMLLLVTGKCNLNCPQCAQGAWRKDHADYHMTPDEIRDLCERIVRQGLHFEWAQIMGGEPALWQYLMEGCTVLRESEAFDHVEVFSNCHKPKPLIEALEAGLIDRVVTQTVNGSRKGIAAIRKRFPGQMVVTDQPVHKVQPDKPLDGVLPSLCGCNFITVFGGRVWPCPGAYHHMKRLGLDVDASPIWTSVFGNWWERINRMDRFNQITCTVCLANGKVWARCADSNKRGEIVR